MKTLVYPSPLEVVRAMAELFIELSAAAIKERKICNVSLSGGSSPKALYELLQAGYCDKINWSVMYFFFGDERYVPFDDLQSNGLMAKKALFDPLHIKDDHIFYINTALPPAESAFDYEKRMVAHFEEKSVQFDIILLGLGDNAHTASLFPHTSVLHEKDALIKEIFVKEVNQYRITFTAPLINNARNVIFLVYGKGKAQAVHQILEEERDFEMFPAQLIQPVNGELFWVLDKSATELLHH